MLTSKTNRKYHRILRLSYCHLNTVISKWFCNHVVFLSSETQNFVIFVKLVWLVYWYLMRPYVDIIWISICVLKNLYCLTIYNAGTIQIDNDYKIEIWKALTWNKIEIHLSINKMISSMKNINIWMDERNRLKLIKTNTTPYYLKSIVLTRYVVFGILYYVISYR